MTVMDFINKMDKMIAKAEAEGKCLEYDIKNETYVIVPCKNGPNVMDKYRFIEGLYPLVPGKQVSTHSEKLVLNYLKRIYPFNDTLKNKIMLKDSDLLLGTDISRFDNMDQ